jgi:hypothetical protein
MPNQSNQTTKSVNDEGIDETQTNHLGATQTESVDTHQLHPTEASELTRLSLRSVT